MAFGLGGGFGCGRHDAGCGDVGRWGSGAEKVVFEVSIGRL